MDITIATADLRRVLKQLTPFVKGSQMLPILGFTKVEAKNDMLYFETTNLEEWVEKHIPVKVAKEGSLCINTKVLNDLASNLSIEELRLAGKGDNLTITGHNISATINGMSLDDFPVKPKKEDVQTVVTLDSNSLSQGIGQVIDAVSTDVSRQVLTGIYMQSAHKKLYLVATDGYRLARQMLTDFLPEGQVIELVVSAQTLQLLPKLFEDEESASISCDDNLIFFDGDHTTLSSRLVDGAYPDYEKLMPTTFKTHVSTNKQALEDAMKAITVFSKHLSGSITLNLSSDRQTLVVNCEDNTEVGNAEFTTDVTIEGDSISSRMNSKYVLNALNHIDSEDIMIGLNEAAQPVLFTEAFGTSDYQYIVMPLKAS